MNNDIILQFFNISRLCIYCYREKVLFLAKNGIMYEMSHNHVKEKLGSPEKIRYPAYWSIDVCNRQIVSFSFVTYISF